MTTAPLRLALAVLLPLVAACAPPAGEPASVTIAHEADVMSLDPLQFQETATHSVLSNLYEGLVGFDRDMVLSPALAVSWNAADETTWLFELQQGVRFHDGTPLTAAEVKAVLDRARTDPTSGVQGQLATVEVVDAVDARTLKIRTVRRDPLLLNRLSYVLIARKDGERLSGTGPYRLVRWSKGASLEAEAFDGYRKGKPRIQRVVFVPVPEGEQVVTALKQGRVDVLRWIPETMVGELRAVPGVRVTERSGLMTYCLWMRCLSGKERNPFSDVRVRRAVAVAIDRDEIVRALGGHGLPSHQLVPKGVFGFVASLPEIGHDPQQAKRLLAQAGYGAGFDVTLVHREGAMVSLVAERLKEMLGAVGVRVKLSTPDWSKVVEGWKSASLPFFLAGWRFENGDATSFLRDCLMTRDEARHVGTYNPGISSAALDKVIDEQDAIVGQPDRLKHYEDVMGRAMEEMPVIPLYTRSFIYGVSHRVQWEPRVDAKLLAVEMSVEQH